MCKTFIRNCHIEVVSRVSISDVIPVSAFHKNRNGTMLKHDLNIANSSGITIWLLIHENVDRHKQSMDAGIDDELATAGEVKR